MIRGICCCTVWKHLWWGVLGFQEHWSKKKKDKRKEGNVCKSDDQCICCRSGGRAHITALLERLSLNIRFSCTWKRLQGIQLFFISRFLAFLVFEPQLHSSPQPFFFFLPWGFTSFLQLWRFCGALFYWFGLFVFSFWQSLTGRGLLHAMKVRWGSSADVLKGEQTAWKMEQNFRCPKQNFTVLDFTTSFTPFVSSLKDCAATHFKVGAQLAHQLHVFPFLSSNSAWNGLWWHLKCLVISEAI